MSELSTEGFQRKVLICATRGRLLREVPGAFQVEAFGADDGGGAGRTTPPRLRLARLLETFIAGAGSGEAPGVETMDYLVLEAGRLLGLPERAALEAEWRTIRDAEFPSDPIFVANTYRLFIQHRALTRALLRVSDIQSRPNVSAKDLEAARVILAEPFLLGTKDTEAPQPVLTTAPDRLALWGASERSAKIPTGFLGLDAVLAGGIRRGEVFYFLAPPKGTKTTALINVALGAIKARVNVLLLSYEMDKIVMLRRFDRAVARATKMELHEDPRRLLHAVRGFTAAGTGEIWVRREVTQERDTCARALRLLESLRAEGEEIGLLVMDFLNIMGASTEEREKRHELPRISRDMAALASEGNVGIWSAALVNRQAVNKARIRKTDIAEAFEVIAVAHGVVGICADAEMRNGHLRRLFGAAFREEEDERDAGLYVADIDRMLFREAPEEAREELRRREEAQAGDSVHKRRREEADAAL